jgi:flagellar basal-body rod modification protein FlgD
MAQVNTNPLARPDGASFDPLATPTRGSNKLGKDEFLKLLMTQLSSQDPTSPTDSEAFVAQLAQFASLEMQQNTNTQLENLLVAQASANQTSMANFVGKDVVFKTDTVTLTAGQPALAEARLGTAAEQVTVVVTDGNGKPVRTMQLGRQQAGSVAISWDGRDDRGIQVPAGEYKLRVTAEDAAGKTVAVEQRGSGHVSGVAFEDGVVSLKVGGAMVRVSDVLEIKERTTP